MQQDSRFIWYVGLLAAGDGLFPCDNVTKVSDFYGG